MVVLYGRATVNFWGTAKPRRWQSAIAIVAALSLFAAVTAGWALRSGLAAAAVLQPAAWSQGNSDIGVDVGHLQFAHDSQPTNHLDHGSSPTRQKPFRNAWMTRDRPPTRTGSAPQSVWSPLPVSSTRWAPLGFQLGEARSRAPAAALADQDILTRLCVARR